MPSYATPFFALGCMIAAAVDCQSWDARTRSRAITIFTKLSEAVHDFSSNKRGKALFREYLVPLLPEWMGTLAALIGQPEDRSDVGVKVAALASASVLIDLVPQKVRRWRHAVGLLPWPHPPTPAPSCALLTPNA